MGCGASGSLFAMTAHAQTPAENDLRLRGGDLPRCHAEWKQLIEQHPWEVLREMLLEEPDEGQLLTTD